MVRAAKASPEQPDSQIYIISYPKRKDSIGVRVRVSGFRCRREPALARPTRGRQHRAAGRLSTAPAPAEATCRGRAGVPMGGWPLPPPLTLLAATAVCRLVVLAAAVCRHSGCGARQFFVTTRTRVCLSSAHARSARFRFVCEDKARCCSRSERL